MEFWGAEVKSGEPLKVQPGDGMVLHLSQASIGEVKKDKANDTVCLFVNVGNKKLVLGTLFADKLPQQQFDLVFDRAFELSHNWKSGSVYFYGYLAMNPFDEDEDEDEDESESEEDIPLPVVNNGKSEAKPKRQKSSGEDKANDVKDSAEGKQKVKIVEPPKEEKNDDDDEDDSDDDDMSDSDDSSMEEDSGESGSEGDFSDESDEETPEKPKASKKRPGDSAIKTPAPDKKAKVSTPQKTDGKKGVHIATPHPSKQAVKTPGNKNQQTPKSGGNHKCKSCDRTFGSENALDSHTKAKHAAK